MAPKKAANAIGKAAAKTAAVGKNSKAATEGKSHSKTDVLAAFVASVAAENAGDGGASGSAHEENSACGADIAKRPAGAYKGKRDRAKNRAFHNMLADLPEHVRHVYDNPKCGKKTDIINALMNRETPSSEWQLYLNAPMFEDHTFETHV